MIEKKLCILYEKYYDFDNRRILSGGVQTYLNNLIALFKDNHFSITLYQFDSTNRTVVLDNCLVKGISKTLKHGKYSTKKMINSIKKEYPLSDSVFLFADSCLNTKVPARYVLSIQHGIWWDVPRRSRFPDLLMAVYSCIRTYKEHHNLKFVDQMICVDYNFPNWYKAQVDSPNCKLLTIPNFTKIPNFYKERNTKRISVIFARRLVQHRGTRVFADAAIRILDEFKNVDITVAGRGPDLQWIHNKLAQYSQRVSFIEYDADESFQIHEKHDIAIIPTVGSEGTSFSLLEAMAAKCAVICTDVGGMTNIIIDGYNGIMARAGDSDSIYNSLKYLIENPEFRKNIAKKGYETVQASFNYDKWRESWQRVIEGLPCSKAQ